MKTWAILFQDVLDRDRQGKSYGQIPWRLGVLEPQAASAPAAEADGS